MFRFRRRLILVAESESCHLPADVDVAATSNCFVLRSMNSPDNDVLIGLAVEFGGFRRRGRR
jgi:hypothetical protein